MSVQELSRYKLTWTLCLLPHLHSTFPREVRGTFMLWMKFVYLIFNKRAVSNQPHNSEWTHVWYSPPQNGGKIKFPKSMIKFFPCLGEFSYQNMLAVTIMKGMNDFLVGNGYMPIAVRERRKTNVQILSQQGLYSSPTTSQQCLMLYMHTIF